MAGDAPPKVDRVSADEAQTLLREGYVYVDVRSEEEFEQGHVPGALNVPWMHRAHGGLTPNPDFLTVALAAFAKDDKLLIGCQSGSRSMKAATALSGAGYSDLRELRTGFGGTRDAFGRLEPGWSNRGFPVEKGAPEGQRYADVKQRRR